MAETITTSNRHLEYTTDGEIVIARAGKLAPTVVPKKKRLSRNSAWKRRNRKLRSILEDPLNWNVNSDEGQR